MHTGKTLVIAVALLSACKKDDKKTEGGEAKAGGGGEAKAAAGFEAKPVEFTFRTWSDNRDMKFAIQANVPKGWKLMTEGENVKMLQTFMPGDTDPKTASMFSTSSLTYSATCNGSCVAKTIPAQMAKLGQDRLKMHGEGAKLLKDGELSPGVYGFVVEHEGMKEGAKQYNVGAAHHQPDWDSAVFCEGVLIGADGKRYQDFLDACASVKFEVIDAVVGAERSKQEAANLANCPAATTLTYAAKEAKPDEPVFDSVKAVQAESTQVGAVTLRFANVARTGDEWRDKPLEAGQGVVEIYLGLAAPGPNDDVLSGTYKNEAGSPLVSSISLKVAGGTAYTVGSGGKADVEIVARTRKKICGKINAEDEWRSIKGEFVADLVGRAAP